jgi:hypothetical protein
LNQKNIGLLQIIYEQQHIRFGNAFMNKQTILQDLFQPNREESEDMVETRLQNGPIYLTLGNFPNQIHDLRDICVSLQGKFQVAEIISDAKTVHSLYKYIRNFRANHIHETGRRIFILSFFCIIYFVNFFSF